MGLLVKFPDKPHAGVINVEFEPADLLCEYKMVLFTSPAANNPEECNSYAFYPKTSGTVIHSFEKNLCLTETSSCRKTRLNFFYQYVYTGCYAIAFVVNEQYIFMKQEFLRTEYNKTEIPNAIYRCTYQSTQKDNGSSLELVSIATDVSLLAGPVGLKFELVPASPLFEIDGDTNHCNRDESPIISHRFSMNVRNNFSVDQPCSVATSASTTGDEIKNVECKFTIDNSPIGRSYCLIIRILDARCHRGTLWNPPKSTDMTFPCSWKQYCEKLERKLAIIEDVKKTYDRNLEMPNIIYLVLIVIVVSVVIAVLILTFVLYRRRLKRIHINSLNNKNRHFDEDGSNILELNGSKSQKEKLVKESGILLLYVKESEQFMNLMSEFRKVLEKHTGCDVYDWWALEHWNDVAYTGGYEWITNLIRKDYRVIWMDTQRSRTLAALPRKNGYDKIKPQKNSRHNQDAVDFRDNIYPTIVDFTKRTNQNLEQEYQRYFVVRLETFKNADKTEDPLADLSPHVRYLIPCHLDKLCCQLSLSEPYEDEMNADKFRLRKYLSQESIVGLEE
ncbi:uncharacterized protein LOC131665125 isoform X2 [Phymastichus coffea]|uniref:uncharacterized protein LOC131665125 isoform X2 n=1 Tax=Phymastichus coffea TaxID=108790 RepID=UPI00273AD175|nr:uncharacterized protein LOC131665125 isoform X2 [Phymastichus coffea]